MTRGTFRYCGAELIYLDHPYNRAAQNMRTVEIPIARWYLARYPRPAAILEVGNVLSHYGDIDWPVLDVRERGPQVINADVMAWEPPHPFDFILSISTVEHVGYGRHAALTGPVTPAEVLARCRAVLQSLGKTITHVGDHGAGQTAKLCNQVAGALNNLAVAEALTLAAASGLDPGRVLEAIAGGAAGSWMMSNFGPRILARDFAPGFMVDLQQKDLRLVLEAANELGVALPGVSLVHQWFNAVQRAGLGREGTQALVKAYEMQHGLQVGA